MEVAQGLGQDAKGRAVLRVETGLSTERTRTCVGEVWEREGRKEILGKGGVRHKGPEVSP